MPQDGETTRHLGAGGNRRRQTGQHPARSCTSSRGCARARDNLAVSPDFWRSARTCRPRGSGLTPGPR